MEVAHKGIISVSIYLATKALLNAFFDLAFIHRDWNTVRVLISDDSDETGQLLADVFTANPAAFYAGCVLGQLFQGHLGRCW